MPKKIEDEKTNTKPTSSSANYLILALIAIVIIVGIIVVLSLSGPSTYNLSLTLQRNGSGTLYPYQTAFMAINVTNLGGREIVGLPVIFYVNGQQESAGSYAIMPHESITIMKNYTFVGYGQYQFSAAADPANVLGITNRSDSQSTIYINSTKPEIANVYTSTPNVNITYTDSFSASGTGLYSASILGGLYNVSPITNVNGLFNQVISKLYSDTYQYINVANGAFTTYSNGTKSYVVWLQGTITPQVVSAIVSSFQKSVHENTTAATPFYYSALSNSISLCYYYSTGWTKLIELYNSSLPITCQAISASSYNATESNEIVANLKDNPTAAAYQQKLVYLNSTALGNMLEYQNSNLTAYNLFQNSYGIFLSGIEHAQRNLSSANSSCLGLIYSTNGLNVCSMVVPEAKGVFNNSFNLVRSTYMTSNYLVMLYSLVNESNLLNSHYNAAKLINTLNISKNSLVWQSAIKNSCGFVNSSITCSVLSFSNSNYTAQISLKNNYPSSITLTNITCAIGAGFTPYPLNYTLQPSGTQNLTLTCQTLPISGVAAQTSFYLGLGYLYKNQNGVFAGDLNATNIFG